MKVKIDNGTFLVRFKRIISNPGSDSRPQVFYTNYYNTICLYYQFENVVHKTVIVPNDENQDDIDLYLSNFGEVLYAEDIEVD